MENKVYIVTGNLPTTRGVFLCYRTLEAAMKYAMELADEELPEWVPTHKGWGFSQGEHEVRIIMRPLL